MSNAKFYNILTYNNLVKSNFIASIPNTEKAIFQHGTANNIEYFLTQRAYYVDTKNGKLKNDFNSIKWRYKTMSYNNASYGALYDIYMSDGLNFHRILNTTIDQISGNLERASKHMQFAIDNNQEKLKNITETAYLIK